MLRSVRATRGQYFQSTLPHIPPSLLLQVWSFPVWLGQLSLCCDTFKYKKYISKSKTKSRKTVKSMLHKAKLPNTYNNKISTSVSVVAQQFDLSRVHTPNSQLPRVSSDLHTCTMASMSLSSPSCQCTYKHKFF